MDEFLRSFSERFADETIEITANDYFREFDSWDSLTEITLLYIIEKNYGVVIPIEDFKKLQTPKEVYDYTLSSPQFRWTVTKSSMNKEKEVISLIAKILEVEEREISVQTAFVEIPNWDSLAHLQIIAEFENAFKVKIPIEKMPYIKTVKDLLDYAD